MLCVSLRPAKLRGLGLAGMASCPPTSTSPRCRCHSILLPCRLRNIAACWLLCGSRCPAAHQSQPIAVASISVGCCRKSSCICQRRQPCLHSAAAAPATRRCQVCLGCPCVMPVSLRLLTAGRASHPMPLSFLQVLPLLDPDNDISLTTRGAFPEKVSCLNRGRPRLLPDRLRICATDVAQMRYRCGWLCSSACA